LKWVGGGRVENMYQEMVYYNRMHVKTRLSQSILSKIVVTHTSYRCQSVTSYSYSYRVTIYFL
jgi:hypothetical protein